MMEAVQPRTIWIMSMGYKVDEVTIDAYAQHLLKAAVDEKEGNFFKTHEKGLKVHQEHVVLTIRKKMTRVAAKQLISEGHDRVEIEQKVKILEAQRKEEQKQKRKEEREAMKVAQATPNVIPIATDPPK